MIGRDGWRGVNENGSRDFMPKTNSSFGIHPVMRTSPTRRRILGSGVSAMKTLNLYYVQGYR